MSDFRALMALSASQTKESQSAVQHALAQRQRNEELRRKQQAEHEHKEQELARKLRLKHFEDERKERERQQRQEQEKAAKEAALKRREEHEKNLLLYGPKKAKSLSAPPDGASPKWPSSASQNRVRAEVRKHRVPGEDGDDDDDPPEFLTREEKRERKQALQMKRLFHSTKRPSSSVTRSTGGRKRLPGGAVDVTTTPSLDAVPSNKSVKERLAAMPNTLMKLNTVKRDTRTIDEILQDRAKQRDGRVLDGDEARVFDDWFGTSKKEAAKKGPSSQQPAIPVATSGANTPASQGSKRGTPTPQNLNSTKKAAVPAKPTSTLPKFNKTMSSQPNGKSSASSSRPVLSSNKQAAAAPTKSSSKSSSVPPRKRARSRSFTESPPPPKRRVAVEPDIGEEIWKLFGRDRNTYVNRDVFSDDEDMEADTLVLEREERESARIAKREDELALAEERRREEEKRRRRKEGRRD